MTACVYDHEVATHGFSFKSSSADGGEAAAAIQVNSLWQRNDLTFTLQNAPVGNYLLLFGDEPPDEAAAFAMEIPQRRPDNNLIDGVGDYVARVDPLETTTVQLLHGHGNGDMGADNEQFEHAPIEVYYVLIARSRDRVPGSFGVQIDSHNYQSGPDDVRVRRLW